MPSGLVGNVCILLGPKWGTGHFAFKKGQNYLKQGAEADARTWLSRKWLPIHTDEIYYTLNMLVNIHKSDHWNGKYGLGQRSMKMLSPEEIPAE